MEQENYLECGVMVNGKQQADSANQQNNWHDIPNDDSYNQLNQTEQLENLNDAKKDRRDVEEQLIKMKNRIQLLEAQEAKAIKNFQSTKSKAQKIMDYKIRNKMNEKFKQNLQELEREQLQRKNEMVRDYYIQQQENNLANKKMMKDIAKEQANEIKKQQNENQKIILMEKIEDQEERQKAFLQVKTQKQASSQKQSDDWNTKMNQNRDHHQQRVKQEKKNKSDMQKVIEQLERKEVELISRLQQTNSLQQKAMKEFEEVCKMKITDEILQESIKMKSKSQQKSSQKSKSANKTGSNRQTKNVSEFKN